MSDYGESADTLEKRKAMKAEFVRILSARVQEIKADPRQARDLVYELGRLRLAQQFENNPSGSWQVMRTLESAIQEVEQSFADADQADGSPPPDGAVLKTKPAELPESERKQAAAAEPNDHTRGVQPLELDVDRQQPRSSALGTLPRLVVLFFVVSLICAALIYWPKLQPHFSQLYSGKPMQRVARLAPPQPAQTPQPVQPTGEARPESVSVPNSSVERATPLPTTFGVYALSEGQLQELKALPGRIPDRRVAISAAITTPSTTTLASGDIKFIVFKPDGAVNANGSEVRMLAKVSRAMGVDANKKAAMVSAGDSWVVRSTAFPYKAGPVDDQQRIFSLQPESEGSTLSPGRYALVVKGVGYDFTVAGEVTDPNHCVERINAANGAFYSPCPPQR